MEQLRKFAGYLKPYKWQMIAGISFILVSLGFGLLVPYLVGVAIDDLAAGMTWEKVVYYPLVILGVNLASGIFLFLQRRFLINASRHIEFDMRQDFYASLVDQPAEYFHTTRVGDLMARATNDLARDPADRRPDDPVQLSGDLCARHRTSHPAEHLGQAHAADFDTDAAGVAHGKNPRRADPQAF